MSENKNMPELSMDEMDHVSGGVDGIPEKNGTIGTVVAALGNGMYEVDIGGQTVAVRISGKLRMNYIRILIGDRVDVEGNKITYRYRSPD